MRAPAPPPHRDAPRMRRVTGRATPHFLVAAFFSLAINLLYLTSPLYMLQVYDRVLASGSEATLIALTLVAALAFLALGLLDAARAQVLNRAGIRIDEAATAFLYPAVFERPAAPHGGQRAQAFRDLDTVREFIAGNGLAALFDLPWLPVYLAILFVLHPVLGIVASAGALLLLALAGLNEILIRRTTAEGVETAIRNHAAMEAGLRNVDTIRAMGMLGGLVAVWRRGRGRQIGLQAIARNRGAWIQSVIKIVRLMLQSFMLGAGAWLVLEQQMTVGAMFAGTILATRALAPVEQAVGVWRALIATRLAYRRLDRVLEASGAPAGEATALPTPQGAVSVEGLILAAPGGDKPILKGVSFQVKAGDTVGIVGPSGSGKSTLARLLVGAIRPTAGAVRLDGADVFAWDRADFGRHVGYLPQEVDLFPGSVRDNIARFGGASDAEVVEAARRADVHELILRLPKGYDTELGEDGFKLSVGQRQRVALARAFLGEPRLVVLDEPNTGLDAEGEAALSRSIQRLKRAGRTVILVAHWPRLMKLADTLLVIRNGLVEAYGPTEEIRARYLAGAAGAQAAQTQGAQVVPARSVGAADA